MKHIRVFFAAYSIALALFLVLFPSQAEACTTFLVSSEGIALMAKNYDWHLGHGLLLINSSGVRKEAFVREGQTAATWVSEFGSVTFNQYGREFPLGGMNEAGLAMEALWLEATTYAEHDQRPTIGALQWIQYSLDRFSTVEQVVASAGELHVTSAASLHFLVCDTRPKCAVVEFLDGQVVSRSGRTLPVAALTNDTYRASLEFLNLNLGYGGAVQSAEGQGSVQRFARTARALSRLRVRPSSDPEATAYSILEDVAQTGKNRTQWSIVYDLKARKLQFKTASNSKVRTLDFENIDFRCTNPTLMLDLDTDAEGDVAQHLKPYTSKTNLSKIKKAYRETEFLRTTPGEKISMIADYPESCSCTLEKRSSSLRESF